MYNVTNVYMVKCHMIMRDQNDEFFLIIPLESFIIKWIGLKVPFIWLKIGKE